ncbi:hypothetical protein CQ10_33330 [Bradyrhizobium valentinum]|nr:hypothetical protein CQ10_33330 [Bradyrhizobium valentinum]
MISRLTRTAKRPFVTKDQKKYKGPPARMHTLSQNFCLRYPLSLASKAVESFVRLQGAPKAEREFDLVHL